MAKYIERNLTSGKLKQVNGLVTSTGAPDANKLVETDSSGKIDVSVLPTGVGPDVKLIVASEAIGAGKYVNIWDDAGTAKVRLADASNGRDAHGFVKDAVLIAGTATVYFESENDDLTGLTIGSRQYLDTAGGVTETPRATGLHQFLGIAISATSINVDIDDAIELV